MCLHYTPGIYNSKAFSQLGRSANERSFSTVFAVKKELWILLTIQTYEYKIVTVSKGTVLKVIRRALAVTTLPNRLSMIAKVDRHTIIKYSQAALPESIVTVCLAILYDTTVDLIHISESSLFHHGRYDFAAHTTSTIRNHFLVLDSIVFVALELGDEVARRIGIWYDRVLELTDSRFVLVATVEEHDVVTKLLHEFIHLLRFEMDTTANHAVFVDIKLIVAVFKSDQFTTRFDAHAREVVGCSIAPLEDDVFEARKLLGLFDVAFDVLNISANRAIDTVA